MIIDCHGHYTSEPGALLEYRKRQIASVDEPARAMDLAQISDDQIREKLESAQIRLQRERGIDVTLFSPRASAMGHHIGNQQTSLAWTRTCNDMIHRVVNLYPKNFVGVCQLPQSPGAPLENCLPELERCVAELGFVGCNLNPDPSGGHWNSPPLTDSWWHPLYNKLCELEVPAMVHVSASCNPAMHTTGSYYLNADTAAFMQFLTSDVFQQFPSLKIVLPHGGGAVPYHWGRYRGLAQDMKRAPLSESLLKNIYFDTCVYHQAGMDLLLKVIPAENVLFASEMVGAVKGIDPETGHYFDDTRRYVELAALTEDNKKKIFEGNAFAVYPRLRRQLYRQGWDA